jgi:hypothetical protein
MVNRQSPGPIQTDTFDSWAKKRFCHWSFVIFSSYSSSILKFAPFLSSCSAIPTCNSYRYSKP